MYEYTLFNTKLKSCHIIIILALTLFFFHILFFFGFYSSFLKFVVGSQKALKPGNEVRDFYIKIPVPLDFRVYFFNITNPEDVKAGAKPIVTEIGPYCYDAYKDKIDVEDDKLADTLTYTPYETYFFNQTRSGDKLQDDYVTILNPLTVGIVMAVADQKPQYLGAINKVLPIIFKENAKMYMTVKVRDVLFDGVMIDCNVRDFSATAVCSQFKGQPSLVEVSKNLYKFSLLGPRNGTIPKRITVNRGIKVRTDLGRVVAVDNKTDLEVWSNETCNRLQGTDGWIFPSFLTKEEGVWSVSPDICRSVKAKYVKDFKFHGVPVRKYWADFGDMSNPEEKCFCSAPDTCAPKGVMDLTKCLKVPIYCSLPHFLEADPKLFEQVEGLHPDEEKHRIVIYFEPITATPLYGQRRIQFNLNLRPLQKIDEMKNIREVLHPILWLEEGVELQGFLLNKVRTAIVLLRMCAFFRYAGIMLWLQLLGYGCYKAWKDWKSQQVAPMEATSAKSQSAASQSEKIDLQSTEASPVQNATINNGHY